jgi:hypothetical protein
MKKIIFATIISISTCTLIQAQSKHKSQLITPKNFKKKTELIVAEKNRNYYYMDAGKTSVIYLKGPGTLKVITRAQFGFDNNEYQNYDILYTVDGGKTQKFRVKGIQRSKKATFQNGKTGVPAVSKSFKIRLSRGHHNIVFKLKNNDTKVVARYIFYPEKTEKKQWISYTPSGKIDPVELIIKEDIVKYYRFSKENPLTVDINGPTELRVLTRIENHYHMQGKINYRIQVIEKGKVINTYQLSSKRSEVTVYKKDKSLVPGKAREFAIEVPRGNHQYKLVLIDESKNTILGRLLIAKKDVKLEK